MAEVAVEIRALRVDGPGGREDLLGMGGEVRLKAQLIGGGWCAKVLSASPLVSIENRPPSPCARKAAALVRKVRPQIVNAGTPKAALLVKIVSWLLRVSIRIYIVWGLRGETARRRPG